MDKKSKILLWVLGLLIVGSVGFTYWRIIIKKDYIIDMQGNCDPTTQKCFISLCDPTAETCTGDPDKDTTYYSKVDRLAYNIPLCDPADDSCQAMVCPDGEKDCTVTYCDDKTKGKDDQCSDPDTYNAAHPATGGGTTCDPSDPTCVTSDTSGDGAGAADATGTAATDNAPAGNSAAATN